MLNRSNTLRLYNHSIMNHGVERQTLVNLRKQAGLTQKQVAEALGLTVATISYWETGVKEPRLDFVQTKKLTELYQCSLDDLAEALESLREKRQLEPS